MQTKNIFKNMKNFIQKATNNKNFPIEKFVDISEPNQKEHTIDKFPIDDVQNYLRNDFKNFGFEDGYKYHSKTNRDLAINSIKTRFIFLINKKIDTKKIEKLQLEKDYASIDGISEVTTEKIKLSIEKLIELIIDLEEQLLLAKSGLGWIESSITDYILGYEQGISNYFEINEFLNLNTNI